MTNEHYEELAQIIFETLVGDERELPEGCSFICEKIGAEPFVNELIEWIKTRIDPNLNEFLFKDSTGLYFNR